MTSKRLHLIFIIAIAALCLGLIGMAYGVNKLLAAEAASLVELKAKEQALAREQVSLENARHDIQKYAGLEKITKTVVPESKTQAEAVREIVKIAAINGVQLGSITFPPSTLGGGTAAGSTGRTTVPVGNPDLSQLKPVPNISSVYLLEITVSSDTQRPVQYSRLINFLRDLERNRRTSQVSAVTLQPTSGNPDLLNFTLTINGYVKP